LLDVRNLSKEFPLRAGGGRGRIRAVHDVSFTLDRGRTLGLVGESGCGKSTTGRLILRLIEPSSGSVRLDGEELTTLHHRALKPLRRRMQIVFQDPLGSLNPRHSIGEILAEPLLVHGVLRGQQRARVAELLRDVELPQEAATRYPHEFSGGQRQRIAIARALALNPELIVADEPVSALDASIQSQIIMLLKRLQAEHGIALLFISHDLSVVRYLCDEVAVMYFGGIVEHGPTAQVLHNPRHPYTQALLAAIPEARPGAPSIQALEGGIPDPTNPPAGCTFSSRCPHAMPRCSAEAPRTSAVQAGHIVRCWLNESGAGQSERRMDIGDTA
jgi:oligopeptide/dipeptide ABC transporter ATP-binding protein